jgi:hypothetical protein
MGLHEAKDIERAQMVSGREVKNPVEARADRRRKEWEAERIGRVRQQLEDGLITQEEAAERGL